MNFVLFDHPETSQHLLPFTFTRPIAGIRVGILTIAEKWEKRLGEKMSYITQDYLAVKFPYLNTENQIFINGALLPDDSLIAFIKELTPGETLFCGTIPMASRLNYKDFTDLLTGKSLPSKFNSKECSINNYLDRIWKIFQFNGGELEKDYRLITHGRKSGFISASNNVLGVHNIFMEESAVMECSIINARTGPVYIGEHAEVQEGSMIRGPFALCEHSSVKMGAKIYGPTTIGPFSKVGGEVNNSVIFGFSNKAHDGFLGNSVIGEWCNLGADTNNSNLKNNYSEVKVWNGFFKDFINSGLQFCGLFMGDHSKSGINTMFNTGTVTGVSANIFGSDFPEKFIPSFSWGGATGLTTFRLEKAIELASMVYLRRGLDFGEKEKKIFISTFKITEDERVNLHSS